MTENAQDMMEPAQDTMDREQSIESILAQEAPGKAGPEQADALASALEGMSNEQLASLLEQAYQEDPTANSVVIQKATKLLQDRGAGEQAKEALKAARSEDWRQLLGDNIGSKAWELISEHTGEDELLEYGKEALDSALDALVGLIGETGLEGKEQEAITKLAQELAKEAQALGEKWLASESGQKIFQGVSRWVDDNPGYILIAAVLGAATAVAMDLDIPMLEQKFKIGDGLTVSGGIDPGSLRNIAFEAAKLDLEYVSGQFKAAAGVNYEDGKTSGEASVRYGDDTTFIQTSGQIDPDGKLLIGLDAALKKGMLSGNLDVDHDVTNDVTTGTVKVQVGGEQLNANSEVTLNSEGELITTLNATAVNDLMRTQVSASHNTETDVSTLGTEFQFGDEMDMYKGNGQFSLGPDGNQFSAGFGRTQRFGDFTYDRSLLYDNGTPSFEQGLSYDTDPMRFSLRGRDTGMDGSLDTVAAELGLKPSEFAELVLKYGRDQDGVTASGRLDLTGENASAHLGVDHSNEETRLNAGGEVKRDNWTASASVTANLTTSQIEQVSAKLGFRDPEEFRAFSVEFAHKIQGDASTTELNAMFEATLGEFMIRGTMGAAVTNSVGGQELDFNASMLAARPLNDNWALIGGASTRFNSNTGQTSIIPQLGVQYKQIPVTVGYDFQNKGVMIGVTIPFGR